MSKPINQIKIVVPVSLVVAVLGIVSWIFLTTEAASGKSPAITTYSISGTIRYYSSPVNAVPVQLNCDASPHQDTTTNPSGVYSFNGITAGDNCMVFVRPLVTYQMAFRNWSTTVNGNITKDFDLIYGNRLQGHFHKPDGSDYTTTFWMGVNAFDYSNPPNEWLGETAFDGSFDMVLPAGNIYRLNFTQPPYYVPHERIDLRYGNVTGLVITLLDEPQEAVPTTPPEASQISVGPADNEGYALVSGEAGSVEPLSKVSVLNLDARNITFTVSDSTGAFSVNAFAPPGSAMMVKYDPDDWRTDTLIQQLTNAAGAQTYIEYNPLPGTILNVGPTLNHEGNLQEFASVGDLGEDPSTAHPGGLWAGWWLSGWVEVPVGQDPLHVPLYGSVTLKDMVLHVSSPAMNCSGTPAFSVNLQLFLRYLFASDGSPHPWGTWFTAHLFTPTGMPIEHEGNGEIVWVDSVQFNNTSFTCDSTHSAHSTPQQVSFIIPDDLPVGTYQIQGFIYGTNIPQANTNQVKSAIIWYDQRDSAYLPPLTYGNPSPPHIPWSLLADYPIDGRRGVQAMEDQGSYMMVNRVTYPPEKYVVPRLDPRSGEPLVYRLEPGSQWLSASDRRFPNPPRLRLKPASGWMVADIYKPNGGYQMLGAQWLQQTSQRTPVTLSGNGIAEGTGQISDLYHLTTRDSTFEYSFDQYGHHVIALYGVIQDIYGQSYEIQGTYEVEVARVLDIDPASLPSMPYKQGDYFAPGVHVYPPVPADVAVKISYLPYSNPISTTNYTFAGQANRFGYFQPSGTDWQFEDPGEFRVDINAVYTDTDGTLWYGSVTWGSVVGSINPLIEAHGRRGMDYTGNTPLDPGPTWFVVDELDPAFVGIENYYPYWSGDIHWGNQVPGAGDSIHTILTFRDPTGSDFYDIIKAEFANSQTGFRWPPSNQDATGLDWRIGIDEAPLFISTNGDIDAGVAPEGIRLWGYWYGSSERPDVHVRDLISEDNMGTAYWRFNDTYNMQIGEGAMGDLPGDLKWEFGGIVLHSDYYHVHEYDIYSSLWTLLPDACDAYGCTRVTPPFQDALGVGINGGPIMTLQGQEIDMLFLPKGVRPGDILEVGDEIAFSGHVGPPLNSLVTVTIVPPTGPSHTHTYRANKIGWVYAPSFNFIADEPGRWIVYVDVEHDQPLAYASAPTSHNTGTVLGTSGWYEFYVVEPDSFRMMIRSPMPGFLPWVDGRAVYPDTSRIEPIIVRCLNPGGATSLYYTIHDKGVVMAQGSVPANPIGTTWITYDPQDLHQDFPMLSLTAHEGRWEGLSDEVTISVLAVGSGPPQANVVTLIGEEVFVKGAVASRIYLPLLRR